MPHRFTGRAEGDLRHDATGVEGRRRAVVDLPWRTVHQVHGAAVSVVVGDAGGHREPGDAIVTADRGVAVAVFTADCAPVVLETPDAVAAVHAGWRGLVAGVIPAAVEALRRLDPDGPVTATLGPCIHAECYEFSPDDLDAVAAVLGAGVRARTAAGAPALDVPAAVRAALTGAGVTDVRDVDVCTSCSAGHWSHRARQDPERQAAVVWLGDA